MKTTIELLAEQNLSDVVMAFFVFIGFIVAIFVVIGWLQ